MTFHDLLMNTVVLSKAKIIATSLFSHYISLAGTGAAILSLTAQIRKSPTSNNLQFMKSARNVSIIMFISTLFIMFVAFYPNNQISDIFVNVIGVLRALAFVLFIYMLFIGFKNKNT